MWYNIRVLLKGNIIPLMWAKHTIGRLVKNVCGFEWTSPRKCEHTPETHNYWFFETNMCIL